MQLLSLLCALLLGLSIPFPGRGARVLTSLPAWEYSHAIWSKDGHRLLYIDPSSHVQLLDLHSPKEPKQLTSERATDATWSPDELRFAYTADRPEGDYFVNTIYVKPVAGGEPIDLLPGSLAISSVSTQKRLHGWFEDDVLAYEEHMGTALQQLFLLDMRRQERYTDEKLMASYFTWDEQKQHVAGQWAGSDPAWFWLWDRKERRFIKPAQPLPGHAQYFEAWSPDGHSLLFTAWDRSGFYGDLGAKATLYRLDVESGQVTKVADQAGLATWAGDGITYVKLEERMSLIVTDAEWRERWRADLGELAKVQQKLPGLYRPVAATTFLSYRRADDSWWVSPVTKKEPQLLFRGPAKAADWTPLGRYLAIHRPTGARTERTQLQVLENPLAPGKPITLERALQVATAAARRWRPNPELLRGFSQQTYEEQEAIPPPGLDGRRRGWAFEFVDPQSHEFVIIGLWDGKVTGVIPAGTDTSRGCDPGELKVTSAKLIEQAKAAQIEPGSGGIAGYSFQARYDDLYNLCTAAIAGADAQGKGTSLTVDARTGQPLPPLPPVIEAERWQPVELNAALARLTAAAQQLCPGEAVPGRADSPEETFISAVRPLLDAALAGIYGGPILSGEERVTRAEAFKQDPAVLRTTVELHTYVGAHNPYEIVSIDFELAPGAPLRISRTTHRPDPRAHPSNPRS